MFLQFLFSMSNDGFGRNNGIVKYSADGKATNSKNKTPPKSFLN